MFSARVVRKGKRNKALAIAATIPLFLEQASVVVQAEAKRDVPVDTGNLRGSINRHVDARLASVGTNVEYAEHVEYGTRRAQAQPYLRPAIDKNRKPLTRLFAALIRKALRG